MPNYRRLYIEGGTYFFTANFLERHDNDLLTRHIDILRAAVRKVKKAHPFTIHAFVVLPEHLYCVLQFPTGDADFLLRWRLIKSEFSKSLPLTERRSAIRIKRGVADKVISFLLNHNFQNGQNFQNNSVKFC